jgi:hypothetical protein
MSKLGHLNSHLASALLNSPYRCLQTTSNRFTQFAQPKAHTLAGAPSLFCQAGSRINHTLSKLGFQPSALYRGSAKVMFDTTGCESDTR